MADPDERDFFEESFHVYRAGYLSLLAAGTFVGGFVYLFLYHPTVWGVFAAASFVLATGLFTTTIFLGMRVGVRSLLVAVPIGLACLGLLWLLFKAQRPPPNPARQQTRPAAEARGQL